MKVALKYIAGVLFILASFGQFFEGSKAAGLIFLLIGIICFPAGVSKLEELIKTSIPSVGKYGIVIIGMIAAGALSQTGEKKVAATNATTDPVTTVAEAKSEYAQLSEDLDSALVTFSRKFDNSVYRDGQMSLELELIYFKNYAKLVRDGSISKIDSIEKKAALLKPKLVALQVREFPLMRKAIAEAWSKKLWENDIEVSSVGSGHGTIQFVGGTFAANKNIKDMQETMRESYEKYRFKRAQYKWIPSEEEYTYFKMETPGDGEIVTD